MTLSKIQNAKIKIIDLIDKNKKLHLKIGNSKLDRKLFTFMLQQGFTAIAESRKSCGSIYKFYKENENN